MKLRKLLLTTLILTNTLSSFATHIIGGSLTYEHLGGATYRITQKLYRDCTAGTADFDNTIEVEVLQPDGSPFTPSKRISIDLGDRTILDPRVDTCAFDPGLCVEEAIYTKIVNNLPPGTGGYHLYFLRCCRNANIDNITTPLNTGEGFYTFIPDNMDILTNSSPDWVNFPPVFVCQGQDINFNHAATDKDGDSLYYKFYDPYVGCSNADATYPCPANNPTFPGGVPTFPTVSWIGGFTASNPLGGGGLTLSPNGMLNGIPPNLGYFVVGIMCEEYRDGQLINYVVRDFQYIVVNCPPIPEPGIGPVTGCAGLGINFTNTSTPLTGNSFYWDFGDPFSTTDNSTLTHPSYTYSTIGTYAVMLVAQAGTPCADTIYDTLIVSGVTPDFTLTDTVCVNSPASFNDTSVPTANTTVTKWLWDFGDGGNAVIPAPTHTYTTPGTYSVKLIAGTETGCFDSITKNIFVQALPQAIAIDTFACVSNPVTNLNGMVTGATGGIWSGNGTFSDINDLNTAYTPDSTELADGYAVLILSTTGNGYCPSTSDTMTLTFSVGITADAGNDISVCKDIDTVHLAGTIITASGGQWGTTNGFGSFYPNPFDLNAKYVPDPLDTAAGTIDIYLSSIGNGNCLPDSDTITITFTSIPSVAILSHDTACSGSVLVPISASSSTGSGYWTTLGNGYFTPSDSLNSTNYSADSIDNFNGSVKLIYTSTNNGGCQSYSDTLTIYLIPAPNINFNFTSVCPKDTILFNDLSTSIDPIISWQWDFDDGNTDSIQNPSHVFDSTGIYNVNLVVTSSNGCTNTLNQPVIIYAIPIADYSTDQVCEGMNGFFLDSSTVQGSTINFWQWDFKDGGTDSVQNPIYVYENSGTYNVTLIVRSAQGCYDTITKTIPVQPPPTAEFSSNPFSVKVGEPFSFTDLSFPNIVNWHWDFGDSLGTALEQNPTYSYGVRGNYNVCLTVTDNMTCVDSACHNVIVFLPPVVPNAFSPNGTGANNYFYVLGGPYKDMELKIYNNWGEVIFISNNQAHGWDGKRDGVDQPIGVYIYTVKATTLDDVQHTIKGDVTLLR